MTQTPPRGDTWETASPQLPPIGDPLMTRAISYLLIGGVVVSGAVLAVGLLLLLVTGQTGYTQTLTPSLIVAQHGTVHFPRSLPAILRGTAALKPFAVIESGVLLLIATPVLRVAASVLLFLAERDRLYALVTAVVLVLLLVSLFFL